MNKTDAEARLVEWAIYRRTEDDPETDFPSRSLDYSGEYDERGEKAEAYRRDQLDKNTADYTAHVMNRLKFGAQNEKFVYTLLNAWFFEKRRNIARDEYQYSIDVFIREYQA